jgi:hypothetical protein
MLFDFMTQTATTDDAKQILNSTLGDLLSWRPRGFPENSLRADSPYPDLGRAPTASPTADREDIIFITARFRSGSTLLWNLFRSLDGFASYYEPFNERRWFDPSKRGSRIDPTHRKAEEYWREYEGLSVLGDYYRESWIRNNLYMDAGSWDPAMKRYVELMIEHSRGRPVLQFNRIDFRLPWFRHHFPKAKIIHLYRHPRDQWLSTLVDPKAFPKEKSMTDFVRHDHFYLREWARDLKYRFPFLDESGISSPYQLFYYVWKLSFLYGRRDADHSLSFEDLVSRPDSCLRKLWSVLSIPEVDFDKLNQLIDKPPLGKWRSYSDEEWFQQQEATCETVLTDFFARTSEIG